MKKKAVKLLAVLSALLLFVGCQSTTTVISDISTDEGVATSTVATTTATKPPTKKTTKKATKTTTKTTAKKTTKKTTAETTSTTVYSKKRAVYEQLKTATDKTKSSGMSVYFCIDMQRQYLEMDGENTKVESWDRIGKARTSLHATMRNIGTKDYEAYFYWHQHKKWYMAGPSHRVFKGYECRFPYEDHETPCLISFCNLPVPEEAEYTITKKRVTDGLLFSLVPDAQALKTTHPALMEEITDYAKGYNPFLEKEVIECTPKNIRFEYLVNKEGYIKHVDLTFDVRVCFVAQQQNDSTKKWEPAYTATLDSTVSVTWDVNADDTPPDVGIPEGYKNFPIENWM